ncbi:MATE family efflux transporter [Vibrio hepatarius]|uniref:MATE family efflux transporter n=1 Tax=Vibrio hepatarius TaxID=171383 RepID=UPI001C09912A|nr:MATE family efflux transporter [Vibrio hepatarius]MBU2897210.1 MATE family efflux transporter [Vibrio hepatarius]
MQTSIYRQFWKYTVPTIVAMLVSGLYQVVDGIFIGRYVGADGLAGINIAWPVIGTILAIGMMIGVGTGALISIHQGQKDSIGAKQVLATGLLMLLVSVPMVSGLLAFFSDDFLRWQGAQGRVFELGLQYINVLIGSCIFSLGSIAAPFLLRNDHSPKLATYLMVLGAILNIVFDYVFIVCLGWELTGAAIATGGAQMIVTILGVGYFFSQQATLNLCVSDFKIKLFLVLKIINTGLASFFMYAYGAIMVAIHNGLLALYGDQMIIGAYAILGYIVTVYYLIAEGTANGMQPLVSFNHGACHQPNVRKLLKVATISAVLIGFLFVCLLNLFPKEFVSIFNNTDEELIKNAILGIRLHLFALALDGFLVVAAAYYQAINKSGKAMFVIVGNILIQLPFLYLMPKLMGVKGIWIAYPMSNVALSIMVVFMLIKDVRRYQIEKPQQVLA